MTESIYKTKQRAVILECLKDNQGNSYTVDEIVDLLKKKGETVGRTTVYRYIDFLVQSGQVRKFLPESRKSAAYQYIEHKDECTNHMHLKCMSCGKFEHLGCDFMNGVCEHIMSHHNFKIDNSKTIILGVCSECMKKEEKCNESD